MRNLLALFGACVVTVGGVGWYLDWFNVHSEPADAGKQHIHLEVNKNKIHDDLHKGGEHLKDALDQKLKADSASADTEPPNPFEVSTTSGEKPSELLPFEPELTPASTDIPLPPLPEFPPK